MALNSFPTVGDATSINNRVYRATQSGTYTADIKTGVYRVTRQATTNIIIGSTTVVPSTVPTLLFVNEPQTEITFNSTVSQDLVPWVTGAQINDASYGGSGNQYRINYVESPLGRVFISYASSNGSACRVAISTNGLIWTNHFTTGQNNTYPFTEFSEAPGTNVPYIVGTRNYPVNNNPWIFWSTNLIQWTSANVYDAGGSSITAHNYEATAFGNGMFVMGGLRSGGGTGHLVWATNPISNGSSGRWGLANLLGAEGFSTGAFGNGIFVFGGFLGSVRTSTNGSTWNVANPFFGTQAIRKIIFADGKFVAVGEGGTISVTTDGINWALSDAGFPTNYTLRNVVYNPDEGIWAVSDPNQLSMRISTDLVTWTARTTPTTYGEFSLAYGNQTYVYNRGVTDQGRIPYAVPSLVTTQATVPFTDTYIVLDFKGQIETLA